MAGRRLIEVGNIGLGFYGMMSRSWPRRSSIELLRELKIPRVSLLWNTFGEERAALEDFLSLPGEKALEIHLVNEVGHRNHRLGPYEFLFNLEVDEYRRKLREGAPRLKERYRQYAAEVAVFLARFQSPDLRLYISPGLESNLDRRSAVVLFDIIRPLFPQQTQIVWSPWGDNKFGTAPIPGSLLEYHGGFKHPERARILNMDGVDIEFNFRPSVLKQKIHSSEVPDYVRDYARHLLNFLWFAECNGIGPGGFVDPRVRRHWPTIEMFATVKRIIERSV